MIRINLLPRTQRKVRVGQRQLVIFLVLLVVELGAMIFLYIGKSTEVDKKKRVVAGLQEEIQKLKKEVGDFDSLKRQRDGLLAQRDVISKLQKARTGPVWTMLELSNILSIGKGPKVDEASYKELINRNPNADFNSRWDPRRLWLTFIDEKAGVLKITGRAKDHDDVAELLKRLNLSEYFTGVSLQRNQQVQDKGLGLKVVQFSLSCRIKY